ncbi:MAG TPA: threonine--tRNA ligase [Anaerolineae bacterium]|nr:threonine--tRNA ligase [Anaerolineae bacterium]
MSERYEDSALYKIRHSAAHIMAQAVMEMFPGEAKIAIGPPIENGFYYDFDLPRSLTQEDLAAIETRMREIVAEDQPFTRKEVGAAEARAQFKDQPYKLELIEGLEQGNLDEYGNPLQEKPVISFYIDGPFVDLCRGPHVERTGRVNPAAFKLLNIAGAYWRGDEKNKQLQRVYGTAWETADDLEQYLWRLEEAKRRDHRKLGRELGLFTISQEVGPGLPLWLPKGAVLRDTLERFLRQEQLDRGYLPVVTPHIGKIDLYKTSGHWYTYRDSMFPPLATPGADPDAEHPDGEVYVLKPMNCPHHIAIYKSEPRSYRDLPLRLAENGTVYRFEQSGELSGLLRVRGFTVDDSHLFVTPEQLEEEFIKVVDLVLYVVKALGLEDFTARVGLRDPASPKYVGSDEAWQKAQTAIINAVEKLKLPYTLEEGEAAFYGPKLDFIFRDVLGRQWQLGTVQVDYNLPERFGLEYVGEDGQRHQPVMIHRAPFGSLERMVATLIEHHAGAFPVWLAPVQAQVIPIADRHVAYAQAVQRKLRDAGIRAEIDASAERMQAKIRAAQLQKIPYMLIIGDKEQAAGAVAVRLRSGEDLKAKPLDEFIALAREAIDSKK